MTTRPALLAERTVSGTYRCAPESASSRSRYEPSGQSWVGTVSDGPQSVVTVRVPGSTDAARCRRPGTLPDCQTSRARSPAYQPIRKASTRNDREVVETNRVTASPGSTLACPA